MWWAMRGGRSEAIWEWKERRDLSSEGERGEKKYGRRTANSSSLRALRRRSLGRGQVKDERKERRKEGGKSRNVVRELSLFDE
jgi:hypothetical protein